MIQRALLTLTFDKLSWQSFCSRFSYPVWAEKPVPSHKSSIYIALSLMHTPNCCILSSLKLDHPNSEIREPQTPPECKHTHASRETQCHHTTFPHIHTHKPETHKQMRWSVHALSANIQTSRDTFTSICLTCSNTQFIQWLKVTTHMEDRQKIATLISIAKAASTYSTGL